MDAMKMYEFRLRFHRILSLFGPKPLPAPMLALLLIGPLGIKFSEI